MTIRIPALLVFNAALLLAPAIGAAQTTGTVQSVSNATELDPEDPRAKRASALATLLTGKDAAEAEKYWKAHAIPGSPAATDIAKQVKDLQTTFAAGFTVDRLIDGPDEDVLVMMNSTSGGRGGRMALIVKVERKAPHRVREVKPFEGRRQRGGGI